MFVYKINPSNIKDFLYNQIGTDKTGAKILSKKSNIIHLYIQNLNVAAANILKQDALSIGADLAVPRGTILAQDKFVDAVLIASQKHIEILCKKELSQPFGLKDLAKELKSFITPSISNIEVMGVINANDDSFFKGSRFKDKNAIKQIYQMIEDGATIIDIGAVSSRPGSSAVSKDIELQRVKPICDSIKKNKLYKKVTFSIDSYTPSVIKYALKSGFSIVNDITGLKDDKVAKLVAKYGAKVVIMHMQGDPKTMQQNPQYDNIIEDIDEFFQQQIKKAKQFGITSENIILDIGIGFGKTLEHNLILLQNLEHFKHLGYPLLVGASRKSMIDKIIPTTPEQRLPGTLAIHLEAINQGASIIRTHDTKEHIQAIKVQQAIKNQKATI
jgi:dihydropteroate synthase